MKFLHTLKMFAAATRNLFQPFQHTVVSAAITQTPSLGLPVQHTTTSTLPHQLTYLKKLTMKKSFTYIIAKNKFFAILFTMLIADLFFVNFVFSQTQTYSTPGTYTFVVPAGVTSITVSAWGAGGAGGGVTGGNPRAGGGGEGGSFVKGTITVIPGTLYTVVVGSNGVGSTGNGTAGGASSFGGSSVFNAIGGAGGNAGITGSTFGAGGAATNTGNVATGTSTVSFYGGNGGTATSASTASSGGGGGSAGAGSNGGNGGVVTGGTAGTSGGVVGATGRGATNDGVGLVGGNPGAGGSGARNANNTTTYIGGDGGDGQVQVTWTCASAPNITNFSTAASTPCAGSSSTVTVTSTSIVSTGNYNVYYYLTGANVTATAQLATLNFNTATNVGTFSTIALANAGATTITIGAIECAEVTSGNTASVTVNPIPSVTNSPLTQTVCSGTSSTLVTLTSGVAGTTYAWSATATTGVTGFTASGTSTIAAQTISTTQTTQGTVTYAITPTAAGCAGPVANYTTLVNPKPVVTNTPLSETICSGGTSSLVTLTSNIPSTFAWTASATTGVTGFTTSGTGTIPAQTISTTQATQGTVTYAITPTASGCAGTVANYTVLVNPKPTVTNSPLTQTICTGATSTLVTLTSGVSGTTYSWTASATPGVTGFTASGTSTIPAQTISTSQTTQGTVTYTITPTANGCPGNPTNYTILVNPRPTITNSPLTQTICSGSTSSLVTLTSNITSTFAWTATATTGVTGFTTSGTSAIGAQTISTNQTTQGTVTYAITPTASGCAGTVTNYTVLVNPAPTVSAGTAFTKSCIANTNGATIGEANDASATYSWSPSTGLSSSTVSNPTANPTTTTIYTVTKTSTATGCTGTASVTVTVNNTLSVSAGSAFTKTCSTNASGAAIGETNVSGNTYSWSPATGLSSSILSNPTANPTVTTTYTVTKTNTASGCVATGSVTVTVNTVAPTVSAGNAFTKTCIANTSGAIIGEAAQAGNTYLWSPSTGLSSQTASNPTANPSSTTTYTVTKTTTANGCTAQASVTVTVDNTAPTVAALTGTQTVCEASTTTFSSTTGGGVWSSNNTSVATVNAGVVTGVSGGTASISYTVTGANGCITTVSRTVTVNALPVTTGVIICAAGSGSLTSSTSCPSNTPVTTTATIAGTGAVSGTGITWTNPTRVNTEDNSYATSNGGFTNGTTSSQTLNATNFGFSIPTTATISGIQVTIGRFRNGGFLGEVLDNSVRLIKSGTSVGNNNGLTGSNWGTTETAVGYGTTSDLWGTTWSPADVNSSNFGAALIVNFSSFSNRVANVDYVKIAVTYTVPGSLDWYTVSSGGTLIGSGSPFNPVGIANSGLANTNTAGTTVYYAECSTIPGCRTPTSFAITPSTSISTQPVAPSATCSGTGVQTLSVTATGTGTVTYSWRKGGVAVSNDAVISGQGTATLTLTNPTTANGGNYDVVVGSGCGSITSTTVPVRVGNTWTGGNGNWNAAANWSCGAVPGSADNILISAGNPQLDVDFTLSGNLTLSGSGALTINPTKTLTIATGGTADFGGRPVTIQSDNSGTGAIGQITGTLSNASNVTVERFIGTARRAWRLLTIPVTGTTIRDAWAGATPNPDASLTPEAAGSGTLITGNGYTNGLAANADGFDWFTGLSSVSTSSIRSYNATNGTWPTANTPSMSGTISEKGYMLYVRGDRTVASTGGSGTTTLRPKGGLNQGSQSVSVTTPFAVVGNPYAASVNLDAIYNNSGNSSVIGQTFYVFDASYGTSGAYQTLIPDGGGGYLNATTGLDGAPYLNVNSGEAFIVVKTGGGNLTINESNKTTTAPQNVFRQMGGTSTVSNLSIQLYQATGETAGILTDATMARYNNIYNVAPTEPYDAAKLANFNENISLLRGGRYLSVESRPYPTAPDTLFVPAWNLRVRDYILSVTSNNFAGLGQTAILIDQFTNTKKVIDMNNAVTQYPFSITSNPASSSQSRFMIVLLPTAGGPLPVHFTKISAAPLNTSKVQVNWITASEQGLKSYDIEKSTDGTSFVTIGSAIAKNANSGAAYQWVDDSPAKGHNYYRIRSIDESGSFAYSATALVDFNGKKGIVVTPTVITNRQFTLSLNDMAAGNYKLILTDAAGRTVYQQVIEHAGGYNSRQVNMGKTFLAAGLYNLSVGDVKGNIQNFRLVFN